MSDIILRPKFLLDAQAIWHYIAKDHILHADAWHASLERSLNLLASQPRMGKAYPALKGGFRCFSFGNYLILYKVIYDGIKVYRIIHGARNIKHAWDS